MPALTLQAKLIIAVIVALFIGYSYVWTYHQGQLTGVGQCATAALQSQQNALDEQAKSLDKQYKAEEEQAKELYENRYALQKRKINDLSKSNEFFKQEANKKLAELPIPDELVGVLNGTRGEQTTAPT